MQRSNRRESSPAKGRGGLFGGNLSIRYGLLTILFCIIIIQFSHRAVGTALQGPIDDIFDKKLKQLVIVYSTGAQEGEQLGNYARRVSVLLKRRTSVEIPVYPDTAVSERMLKEHSLILYGPVGENSVADRMRDYFPFSFSGSTLVRGSRRLTDRPWRLIFIVPNPYNAQHYVLVYTAAEAQNVVGINLLGHPNFTRGDTTDYVLADGSGNVERGYFEKEDYVRWSLME